MHVGIPSARDVKGERQAYPLSKWMVWRSAFTFPMRSRGRRRRDAKIMIEEGIGQEFLLLLLVLMI